MSFMDLFEAPLHHGLHTWLTEEMGFVHDVVTDTYRHPERNICVSGTAVRAAAVDCIDADETRTFISDVFFGALPGNA